MAVIDGDEPAPIVGRAMSDDGRVPLGWAVTYKVSADQRRVRMDLPPLRFAGVRKPVSLYMDLDAEAVDAFQRQLAEIRAQMLPALRRTRAADPFHGRQSSGSGSRGLVSRIALSEARTRPCAGKAHGRYGAPCPGRRGS